MNCAQKRGCVFAGEQLTTCNPNVLFASDPVPPAERLCTRALQNVLVTAQRQHTRAEAALGLHPEKRVNVLRTRRHKRLLWTSLELAWADLEVQLGAPDSTQEAPATVHRLAEQTLEIGQNARIFDLSESKAVIDAARLNAYLPVFEKRLQGLPLTRSAMYRTNSANAAVLASCRGSGKSRRITEETAGMAAEMTEELLCNRTLNKDNFLFLSSPREDNHNRYTTENFSHDSYHLSDLEKTAITQSKLSNGDRANYAESVRLVAIKSLIEHGNGFPTTPAPGTISYEISDDELAALEISPDNIYMPIDDTDERFELSLDTVVDLLIREHDETAVSLSQGEKSLLDLLSAHAIIAK